MNTKIDTEDKLVYSVKEFAKMMGSSHSGIYKLFAAGEVKFIKLGGKTLIPKQEIERLLAKPGVPSEQNGGYKQRRQDTP